MDWEKAKTILIIIFLLLNAGLFAMSQALASSYRITPEEVSAITKILENNGISLDCELSSESRPLRFLNVAAPDWDYNYIKGAFFPNVQDITLTYEGGNIIYASKQSGAAVTVTNAYSGDASSLLYEAPHATENAEDYIKMLGERFEGFKLQRTLSDENGESFYYNETIKDGIFFSSGVVVRLFKDGSVTVAAEKYDFVSYVEGLYEIFSVDEALLTFVHYKNDNFEDSVAIESVQLGYAADDTAREKTRKVKPYYRILISGVEEPVYIDAIMNTVP